MIAHLRGKLAQKDPARVVVDVNGVGYEVFIPLTTFTALPETGSEVSVDIHTHVREDLIALYGFSTRRERMIFEKLMTISGIGPKLAKEVCEKAGIPDQRRVNQLTDAEVLQIREAIDRDYVVEGDLRRDVAMNIKRLMDLGCYRGLRHRRGLPVRGQRTHTNARTRKGKARPIAGKKKATA